MTLSKTLNIVNKRFKALEEESISLDIIKLNNTMFFNTYKRNKTYCIKQLYLSDNNHIHVKKLILQLKLGVSHITHKGKVARLKSLEKFYNKTECDICDLCGREQEDTFHLIFVCSHYSTERDKYIYSMSKYNDNLTRENYLVLFNELDEVDSLKLYHFFKCILNRRAYFLEEMSDT
jgi:hypothetical protein